MDAAVLYAKAMDIRAIPLTDDWATRRFVAFVRDYLRYSVSYFDRNKEEPEQPYRLLLLGMAAFYANTHYVRSERESGDGRYDISLEPKNKD